MSPVEPQNEAADFPIIAHSHLQWDWVWQRPQQFLSRLGKTHRVLFLEGPQLRDEAFEPCSTLHQDARFPNVTVMKTFFPASRFSDGEWVDAQRLQLLRDALSTELKGDFARAVQWFYDPMCAPIFIGKLDERAVVYDCMDQLSQFKFAPPQLIEREKFLLSRADVVFAGGRKMWEDKRHSSSNCHFYGCGVDVNHFAAARKAKTPLPRDVGNLPSPRLGYFGVVDERLDYGLVAQLADANAAWQIVMVGPTCKIEAIDLPQRENLHWLGGREYSQLPAYAKSFDVCLMPFALNEATEYINPTKALEYMATGTPIVSSAVPDVVSNFSGAVKIAESRSEFVQLCRDALRAPDENAVQRGLQMANENTWESIVAQLERHVENVIARRQEAIQSNIARVARAASVAPQNVVANAGAQVVGAA